MDNSCHTVYAKLKDARSAGISVADFPKGFRLAARIYDLREMGYDIATVRPLNKQARYVLLRQRRFTETPKPIAAWSAPWAM